MQVSILFQAHLAHAHFDTFFLSCPGTGGLEEQGGTDEVAMDEEEFSPMEKNTEGGGGAGEGNNREGPHSPERDKRERAPPGSGRRGAGMKRSPHHLHHAAEDAMDDE